MPSRAGTTSFVRSLCAIAPSPHWYAGACSRMLRLMTPHHAAYSGAHPGNPAIHKCSIMAAAHSARERNLASNVERFGAGLFGGEEDDVGSLWRDLPTPCVKRVSVHHRLAAVPIRHRENLQDSGAALFRQSASAYHDGWHA